MSAYSGMSGLLASFIKKLISAINARDYGNYCLERDSIFTRAVLKVLLNQRLCNVVAFALKALKIL